MLSSRRFESLPLTTIGRLNLDQSASQILAQSRSAARQQPALDKFYLYEQQQKHPNLMNDFDDGLQREQLQPEPGAAGVQRRTPELVMSGGNDNEDYGRYLAAGLKSRPVSKQLD